MSLVDTIQTDIQVMTAGTGHAQQETAAADHAAQQIALHAAASGFVGIAQNMVRVRDVIGQIQAGIGGLSATLGETASAVAAAPRQPTPQETVAAFAPLIEKLGDVHTGVGGCIARIDQAKQLTGSVLQGGDPGVLLAKLDTIQQVLGTVGQRGSTTRQHVEVAISEAKKTGSTGN